jgi:hypothetical protein
VYWSVLADRFSGSFLLWPNETWQPIAQDWAGFGDTVCRTDTSPQRRLDWIDDVDAKLVFFLESGFRTKIRGDKR